MRCQLCASLRLSRAGAWYDPALMTRVVAAAGLLVAVACNAMAWSLPFGPASGNRVARGAGTFPRWQALALASEAPIAWIVTLPNHRLVALDREGSLLFFDVSGAGLKLLARYGEVASPEGPPVAVRLGQDQTGVAFVGADGRLFVWSEGVLRGYDVGGLLSSATVPTPIAFDDRVGQDLLAVTRDGAVVLIGGLAGGGPRAIAHLDVGALRDARITVADLDGDGVSEAIVLARPAGLGDRPDATTIAALRVRPYGLELRARFTAQPPAAFEDQVPVIAPLAGTGRAYVLVGRRAPGQGAVPVALGMRESGLVLVAEGAAPAAGGRSLQVIGAADLAGDRGLEIAAIAGREPEGVLTIFRRAGNALVAIASAAGYAASPASPRTGDHASDHAVMADFDGDGRPEVVLPRLSREVLVALELRGDRLGERWAIDFKNPVTSNLVAADLDGDGLLDLAVATRRGLHVFLSVR